MYQMMWLLSRFSRPRQDRDTILGLPAVCIDVCNSLMLVAQSTGQVPSLCDDGSDFNNYYQGCNTCIDKYAVVGSTNRTIIDSNMAPYIEFCRLANTLPSHTIDASWLTTFTTFLPTTIQAVQTLGGESSVRGLYTPILALSTLPVYSFHQSVGSMISSYIPVSVFDEIAHSVSLSASAASVTGDATSLIYAALEATSLPRWFSAAIPSTYSSQMYTLQEQINQLRATPISLAPPPTSLATSSSSVSEMSSPSDTLTTGGSNTQGSKTWIAGPVIGGIAVLCLFTVGIFIYRRRYRHRAGKKGLEGGTSPKTWDKPQLHSDHLPPRYLYEMDGSNAPSEADNDMRPEMAVNEVPASELAAGGDDSRMSVARTSMA